MLDDAVGEETNELINAAYSPPHSKLFNSRQTRSSSYLDDDDSDSNDFGEDEIPFHRGPKRRQTESTFSQSQGTPVNPKNIRTDAPQQPQTPSSGRKSIDELTAEIENLHGRIIDMEHDFERRKVDMTLYIRDKYQKQAEQEIKKAYERALVQAVKINEDRYRETITKLEKIILREREEKNAVINACSDFLDSLEDST